ncbi:uncharacterized protein LOC122314701 isoform X2 [Carya illinoinensis]|uniref:uncharacterized protein LOC122314701 isoform X2 n=1 Tax=Carya illinoinensis TaxID=32201 RepID=UPI001C71D053|nr:uncharacterized protein LOC122314701 isoform X2 [Carya illinoinensis]
MKPALVLRGGGSLPHIPSLAIRSTSLPPFLGFTFGSRIQWSLSLARNPIQQKSHTRLALARAAERDHSVAEPPAKALRRILDLPGVHQGPACFDALSAKLVEKAGFQYCFSSACGHTQGRKVVPREEAIMKIKAAIDARKESGSDIVIVARTDSRQAVSLDESLWRCRAFADAGADVLFIDALASKEEMKAFCEISPLVPKMANMLEGGGKTPILNPLELEDIGYKLVCYPLSLIGASIQAMQDSLAALRGGRIPPPRSMPSFEEIKEILGFNTYYKEEQRYATSTNQLSSQRVSSSRYSMQNSAQDDTKKRGRGPDDPIVEVITPYVYNNNGADGSRDPFSQIWSRTLRIKITGRDGFERLDVRIPAGFLEGITNIVPALGGVNIKKLLDDAADEVGGKQLLDFIDTMGDRIQVFLE